MAVITVKQMEDSWAEAYQTLLRDSLERKCRITTARQHAPLPVLWRKAIKARRRGDVETQELLDLLAANAVACRERKVA